MPAQLPLRVDEPGEAFAVEADAPLGEGEFVMHAEQGGEHPGRLVPGVSFENGEWGAVQVLDPLRYLGRSEVGQSGAFTVGTPGPPRHAVVPGRRLPGAGW